ncbi:MAG: hypothetical protein ACRC62_12030 [Microcoleus sp.]
MSLENTRKPGCANLNNFTRLSHYALRCLTTWKKEEGRRKREEGRRKREEGRGKREEGRGKREEGRGKKSNNNHCQLSTVNLYAVNYQLGRALKAGPLPPVNCQLSTLNCQLPCRSPF